MRHNENARSERDRVEPWIGAGAGQVAACRKPSFRVSGSSCSEGQGRHTKLCDRVLANSAMWRDATSSSNPDSLTASSTGCPTLPPNLIRLDVDVIAAVGAVGARAAKKATTQIPIVFVAVIDPVATGFVTALERPGGNVTGIMAFDPQQPRKQLELLKEVFPKLTRVAILSDVDVADAFGRPNDAAARALGLQPQMLKVKGPTPDLEGAFSAMMKEGAEALVILEVPVTIEHQKRIAELAATHRLPTLFPGGQANAGGLITYGTSILDAVPRMPGYVDKISKGAKAGELPVEVITRSELVFNLKTASEIGVTIPSEPLSRADRLVQ